nr:hypothetical protein [Pseudomonas sp.]
MAKYYFVRKITSTLNGEQDIHFYSLATKLTLKARLDKPLRSQPVFPGMTYRVSIVKRGRGALVASLESIRRTVFRECKALATFVGSQGSLPLYVPSFNLAKRLQEVATSERCTVRALLDEGNRLVLSTHLGEAQAAQLQFAWEQYMSFQASVARVMAQGFDQFTAERMVRCLPEDVDTHLLANPLIALPFLRPSGRSFAGHPGFEAVPAMRPAIALLQHLERQSLAGNTLLGVGDVILDAISEWGTGVGVAAGSGVGGAGDCLTAAESPKTLLSERVDSMIEALRLCESHGWIVSNDGWVQLASNYHLQRMVRDHFTRICEPFHPSYSQREIDQAFNRLIAFAPERFAHDLVDEVSLAINSRVLLVRYDDFGAALEFTRQYCAVHELLTNGVPTLVTVAKARCMAYETGVGKEHIPFYELGNGSHERAVVVQQFNQMPLFEIHQVLSDLGNVVNLVLLIDTTLPVNPAIEQMARYFSAIDIQVRRQGALSIQRCFRSAEEIEERIELEDRKRLAVICDCPELSSHLNRRYCSDPLMEKVPKTGDMILLSPKGFRRGDNVLTRVINVKPNELFVAQSHTYRTIKVEEFSGLCWRAGFALSPSEAAGVVLPPVLVFTSASSASGAALVSNLQAQGIRVIEHCLYEIEGSPKLGNLGTLQRIVPLVE